MTDDQRFTSIEKEVDKLRDKVHTVSGFMQHLSGDFEGHELVCSERYRAITEKLDLIISALKWATGLAVLTGIAVIAFYLRRYGVTP